MTSDRRARSSASEAVPGCNGRRRRTADERASSLRGLHAVDRLNDGVVQARGAERVEALQRVELAAPIGDERRPTISTSRANRDHHRLVLRPELTEEVARAGFGQFEAAPATY